MLHFLKSATIASALGMVIISMTAHSGSESAFTATPLIGKAPLMVTFTGTGSGELEGVMLLDFGDGQTDGSISTIRNFSRTHTYTTAGFYTAELKSGAYGGQEATTLTTVGNVEITVQ